MKALNNFILLKPIKQTENKSAIGLVLTDTDSANERYQEGEVTLVGPRCEFVKDNDIITYDKVAGNNIKIKDEVYRIIKESDVVLIHQQ